MKIFEFQTLPKNLEELKAAYPLTSPQVPAALLMVALCRYVENAQDGLDMINYLKGPADLSNYDQQFLKERLRDKPYLPFSYFKGASPENNYTPSRPYQIEVFDSPLALEAGYTKVFLQSGGADSQRPVTVRQKGQEYFVWEHSSMLLGIRVPKAEDPWA